MNNLFKSSDKALAMLRVLPRIGLGNIRDTTRPKKKKRGRGQYGGDKHGAGNKGSGQRQNYLRPGYETGNNPFYMRFPYEPYYKGHHLRKQYPPMSLLQLQTMIDTDRINVDEPIDLATLCSTGLYTFQPEQKMYGIHLTDEGADIFKAKVHIEVQRASEGTIAAIERNGGVITTAYYDIDSLWLLKNPAKFFKRGQAVPRRMLPTEDVIEYYSSAANRGYLADPEEIAYQRMLLAQKFGYELPKLSENDINLFTYKKDPRQIFYGIHPGWIINLTNEEILKPKSDLLKQFYDLNLN